MTQRRAIYIFAAINEGENRAQDACLQFIGLRKAIRGHAGQHIATSNDLLNAFHLALVASFSKCGFAANFGALVLNEQGEVKDTHPVLGEFHGHARLASHFTARFGRGDTHTAPASGVSVFRF